MKIFHSHIFKIPAIALVVIVSSMSEIHATTGDEKKAKSGTETNKKTKTTVESGKEVLVVDEVKTTNTTNTGNKVVPYYEPPYLDKEVSSSGEDQNAVLSFNVIQYIFQRFKFSGEVY